MLDSATATHGILCISFICYFIREIDALSCSTSGGAMLPNGIQVDYTQVDYSFVIVFWHVLSQKQWLCQLTA